MPTLERLDVNEHREGQTIVSLRSSDFLSFSMTLDDGREIEQLDDAIEKLQHARARIADRKANTELRAAG